MSEFGAKKILLGNVISGKPIQSFDSVESTQTDFWKFGPAHDWKIEISEKKLDEFSKQPDSDQGNWDFGKYLD